MVTCKLWAQTANQLFMISATIAHALKMNTSFSIPTRTINPRLWPMYTHHLPKAIPGRATKHYFRQPGHGYTPIPDEDDITLEGYFQSEKYWHNYKEELAEILRFSYMRKGYISIHIRRGDYLQFPDRFPVLPVEYYELAIEYFQKRGYDDFRVFSDDIPWCKKTFSNLGYHFSYSANIDPISDIKDLFNSQGFIISNSTFGLFPALLRNDNPIVIAPAEWRWFGPAGQEMASKDRLPKRFIKL